MGRRGASPEDLFHFQQEPQSRQPFFKAMKKKSIKIISKGLGGAFRERYAVFINNSKNAVL